MNSPEHYDSINDTMFARDALTYAVKVLSRNGCNVHAIETLQRMLDQNGCGEMTCTGDESLTALIDIVVFG